MITVPVLASSRVVLFPGMRCAVHVRGKADLVALLAAAERSDRLLAVFAGANARDELYVVGTLARLIRLGRTSCCDRLVAALEGRERLRFARWEPARPFREASCELLSQGPPTQTCQALASAVREIVQQIADDAPSCARAKEASARVSKAVLPEEVLGAAVGPLLLHLPTEQRQQLLEIDPLEARLTAALGELHRRLGGGSGGAPSN